MTTIPIAAADLQAVCAGLLQSQGVAPEDAAYVAESLVEADLRGVSSHGCLRLSRYIRELGTHITNPTPRLRILEEGPAFARVDGDGGLGPLVGRFAMETCIAKALEAGSATVTACRSRHFGSAGFYASMAARQGLIGIAMTVASPRLAPTGGTLPLFGNNPIAVAAPGDQEFPLLVDFASGSIAAGRLELAAAEGQPIPEGVARDLEGNPTTDAKTAHQGSIVPIGEHKGYGLTLVIEILAGLLGGSPYFGVPRKGTSEHIRDKGIGHFFMAIDPARFMPLADFKAAIALMVATIKASPKMPGVEEIYAPGEMEARRRRRYLDEGIPLAASTLKALRQLCADHDVPFDL